MSRTATTAWRRVTRAVRAAGRRNNTPCGICHGALGPIDYRTRAEADRDARAAGEYWLIGAPRPLAFAADHVIPHAAGGADSVENAQPTHAICNESAGAKNARPKQTARPKAVNGYWHKQGEQPLFDHAIPGAVRAGWTFVPSR